MNDTLGHLLEPLGHLDVGEPPKLRPGRNRRRRVALGAVGVVAIAAIAIPVALTGQGERSLSLADIVLGSARANALPPDADDLVLYQRLRVANDATLVCGDGVLTGDARLDGGGVFETWTHGASRRERTTFSDATGTYDYVTTVVDDSVPGRLIVDTEGTTPEPPEGRSCSRGGQSPDAGPFEGWEGPDQEGVVATLRSGAALGLEALGPAADRDARARLFDVLADEPSALVLTEPAVDLAGRPVVSIQVDIANDDQRYVGTWRFDPNTFELREIVEYEENLMFVGSTTRTILEQAWLPYSDSLLDLTVPPGT
jgi:hypothetical protein